MKFNWQGKKVIVIGAARQGLAAARYLADKGAWVVLTDSRPTSEFGDLAGQFANITVDLHLGGHSLNILDDAGLICVSGGVPLTIPLILEAQKRGILLTNDAQLFMQEVKAKVIGITGSAGKTTTTIFTGAIAKTAVEPELKAWVGGNIGIPLVTYLGEIQPNDWVIHEFSSFQLELMKTSPHIAVITNITPNHLDRHKTMRAYIEAKTRILDFQTAEDFLVINLDDPVSSGMRGKNKGSIVTFSFDRPNDTTAAVYLKNDKIMYFDGTSENEIFPASAVKLPGRHNLANAMASCAASLAAGFSPESILTGIRSVEGIPHRLELVREFEDIRWINDSIATTPERVLAAMRAIKGPLVMLLGGRDKDLPWQDLAAELHDRQPKVVLFGEAGIMVQAVINKFEGASPSFPVFLESTLEEAVGKASAIAEKGDSVLLSPGGTSYDAYLDFEARGEHFRKLVEAVA